MKIPIKNVNIELGKIDTRKHFYRKKEPEYLSNELSRIKDSTVEIMFITAPIILTHEKFKNNSKYHLIGGKRTFEIAITHFKNTKKVPCIQIESAMIQDFIIFESFISKIYLTLTNVSHVGVIYKEIISNKETDSLLNRGLKIKNQADLCSILNKTYNSIFRGDNK